MPIVLRYEMKVQQVSMKYVGYKNRSGLNSKHRRSGRALEISIDG